MRGTIATHSDIIAGAPPCPAMPRSEIWPSSPGGQLSSGSVSEGAASLTRDVDHRPKSAAH